MYLCSFYSSEESTGTQIQPAISGHNGQVTAAGQKKKVGIQKKNKEEELRTKVENHFEKVHKQLAHSQDVVTCMTVAVLKNGTIIGNGSAPFDQFMKHPNGLAALCKRSGTAPSEKTIQRITNTYKTPGDGWKHFTVLSARHFLSASNTSPHLRARVLKVGLRYMRQDHKDHKFAEHMQKYVEKPWYIDLGQKNTGASTPNRYGGRDGDRKVNADHLLQMSSWCEGNPPESEDGGRYLTMEQLLQADISTQSACAVCATIGVLLEYYHEGQSLN